MKELLKKLTGISGPSGYEDDIRLAVRQEIESLADEVRVDALGNLIARKGPSGDAKGGRRIMVAAHMDEIGLIASHVDEQGFVRFAPLGTLIGRYLPGSRVRFLNGVHGLIGYDRLENLTVSQPADKMFIDVGAASRKDCPIRIGDVAAFDSPFRDLGRRVIAKSLDNRAGVLAAIETLRALGSTPNEVLFVFTAQEEVRSRGAITAAYGLEPEIAIAVAVTPAGDTPEALMHNVELDKGPAVKIRDVDMLADPRVVSWMIKSAEKGRIPFQREVLTVGSTDAAPIQMSRSGVLAGALSVPVRYVHSTSELISMDDLEKTVRLLTVLLRSPVKLDP